MSKDWDQAAKMLNMRIKIDVWSRGLEERKREKIREHLLDLFCELPARRVFCYLKRLRHMLMTGDASGGTVASQPEPDHFIGPEDVIVNGK